VKHLFLTAILVGSFTLPGRALDLSLLEFPSEDEIVEAFLTGYITEEEMHIASSALFAGEHSNLFALYDADPFERGWYTISAVDAPPLTERNKFTSQTRLRYRYLQPMSQLRPSQYQIRGESVITRHWEMTAGIDRNYSGRERVRHRTITFTDHTSVIRRVDIGNFSQRLGLGTVFGNRGKILGRSGELDNESILVPDYGGGNGLYALLETKGWEFAGVGSFVRDTATSYRLMAVNISRKIAKSTLWLTVGNSTFKSRESGASHAIAKVALGASHAQNQDRTSAELTVQNNASPILAAAVVEGKTLQGNMTVNYSGWVYHDDFIDDASGSRSGSLRHQWRDSISGAEWTTRRSGAEGIIIRSNWDILSGWIFSTTFLVSAWKANYTETRLAANVERQISARFTLTSEYLQRNNNRPIDENELREQWVRFGCKYHTDNSTARTAVGYISRDSGRYLSWLLSAHFDLNANRRLEFWADIRRIGLTPRAVDYGYLFAQLIERWSKTVETTAKLSTRYDSSSAEHWTPTISAEIELLL
jgi:hypothetical protein